jgi:hypothetical protein
MTVFDTELYWEVIDESSCGGSVKINGERMNCHEVIRRRAVDYVTR